MPLQTQALPAVIKARSIGSKVVYRIEDSEGYHLWTSRSKREAQAWVDLHNAQVVKEYQDQLYIRGHRVLNALDYLARRAARAPVATQLDLF